MKKVYLSGPITGLEYGEAYARFSEAAERLLANSGNDVRVFNPMDITTYAPEKRWQDYMYVCLAVLGECDTILMLKGWERSKGAQIEKLFAEGCGIRVIFE